MTTQVQVKNDAKPFETRLSRYIDTLDNIQRLFESLIPKNQSQFILTNMTKSPKSYYIAVISPYEAKIYEQTPDKKSCFSFRADDGSIIINNEEIHRSAIDQFIPKFQKILVDIKSGDAVMLEAKDE